MNTTKIEKTKNRFTKNRLTKFYRCEVKKFNKILGINKTK